MRTSSALNMLRLLRMLLHAYDASGHKSKANHLCEELCHNLRRVFGEYNEESPPVPEFLASLYACDEKRVEEIEPGGSGDLKAGTTLDVLVLFCIVLLRLLRLLGVV